MTKFRSMKRNGKRVNVPISGRKAAIVRQLTPREIEDLTGVGIRHPGSLTAFGYHINLPVNERKKSLEKAEQKYGKKETLRKLGELYRLDYNRPALKARIVEDIRFVSGGSRND
jgi:hypothetical protein